MTESQFNKWRTLVALSLVDGDACAKEREFVRESVKKRKATEEQMIILESDFQNPQPPCQFFEKISNPKDRGMLFYLARLMFFKDGSFCDLEKMYYDKFKAIHMGSLNMPEIMAEVHNVEVEMASTPLSSSESRPFQIFQSLITKYF